MNIQKIGMLPLVVKLVIYFVVIIVVAYVGHAFLSVPVHDKIDQEQRQEEVLISSLEQRIRLAKSLPELQEQIQRLEKQYDMLKAQLPDDREIPDLIDQVSEIADQSGLSVKQLAPKEIVERQDHASMDIDLSLQGTYEQLSHFLDSISNIKRVIVVMNYRVRPTGNVESYHPVLDINMRLQTYTLLQQNGDSE